MLSRARTRPAMPGFIDPCSPTLAKSAPSGPGWLHEIKHDGYRLMARHDGAGIRLLTRNGYDFTDRFPLVRSAVYILRCLSCVIDGEVVVCRDDGLAVFDRLRHGPRRNKEAILYAFDLIELNGRDMRPVA